MTIPDCVLACVRMGMDWDTVALAYRLTRAEVEDIVRAAIPDRNSEYVEYLTSRGVDLDEEQPIRVFR